MAVLALARWQGLERCNAMPTILNLMGLSDERLTYLHAGRFRKLTDIGGRVLKQVIA